MSIAQSHFGSQPGCSQGGGPPAQVGFRAAEKFGGLSSGVLGFRVILGVSVFPVWAFGQGSAFLGCKDHDNFGFGFRSFGLWNVRGVRGNAGGGGGADSGFWTAAVWSWGVGGLIRGASMLEAWPKSPAGFRKIYSLHIMGSPNRVLVREFKLP